jgi:hypothetical protein
MEIVDVSFLDGGGRERRVFPVGEAWSVRLGYRAHQHVENPVFSLAIDRNDGLRVFSADTDLDDLRLRSLPSEGDVLYAMDPLPLMEGMYLLSASVHNAADTVTYDQLDRPHAFRVRQVGGGEQYGLVSLGGRWDWGGEETRRSTVSALEGASGVRLTSDRRGHSRADGERRWGTQEVMITDVAFLDAAGTRRRVFETGETWVARLHYRARRRIEEPVFGLAVHRADGVHICGPNTLFGALDIQSVEGEGEVFYRVERLPLMEGTYYLSVSAHNRADTEMYDFHNRLYAFQVCQFDEGERDGVIDTGGQWEWDDRQAT